jgi:spore germination cell wall hydrolase CwlJ-like protein
MRERVSTAHRRADGALVVAMSFVILGMAPLVGFNLFKRTFTEVFAEAPTTSSEEAASVEAPVELASARLASESQCLAEAMYHEARGEGVDGQKAVAEVVLQRTRNRNFGNTVCSVVFEGIVPGRLDCQFSFACDGSRNRPKEEAIWRRTKLLAEKIMVGEVKLADRTQRAIFYHSVEVRPYWAPRMLRTVQIGNHVFYRFAPRGSRAPVQNQHNVRAKLQNVSSDAPPPAKTRFPKL